MSANMEVVEQEYAHAAHAERSEEKAGQAFMWSYALAGGGGFMLIQATVASYFSVFMTDTFGVPAGALSVIVFIASLWDAINDPMMGTMADRTSTRWGRYRPYFLIFPLLLAIVSYLLFLAPEGLTDTQKTVYVAVFFILYGMLVTICTMPHMAVLPAHIGSQKQRNKAVMLNAVSVAAAFTIAASFTIPLSEKVGGYANLMLIYGIMATLAFWALFTTSQEKYLTKGEKRHISHDLKMLIKHKELFSVIVVWCMASLGYGLMFSASVYYILYYIARPDLISSYMMTLSIGALLSMMVAMPLCMKIFKTAQKTLKVTQLIAVACYAFLFFFGQNLQMLYVVSFIAAFFASMQFGLVNVLLNDTIDYVMLKDGASLNGTLSAIRGFAFKCGTTVSSTMLLGVLGATGYVAGAIGHQSESTLFAINSMRFLTPTIASIIIIGCLMVYPIEKYYPDIEAMKKALQKERA